MDHFTLQAPDNGADEKWIVANISVLPSHRADLIEKSVSEAASDGWQSRIQQRLSISEEIKTHPMLQRTLSGQWAVDSSFQPSRAVSPVSSFLSMSSTLPMYHSLEFSGERKRRLSSVLLVKKDKSMELVGNFHGEKTVNTSSCSNLVDSEQAPNCVYPDPSDVSIMNEAKEKLKERYREEKRCIFVKSEKHSSPILLNDVFIDPYITKEDEKEDESHDHEMREPKPASNQVTCNIFIQYPEKQMIIKTMLIKGIAKIGKTICRSLSLTGLKEKTTRRSI